MPDRRELDAPRPKKRRTLNPAHQACSACKSRKVRCDAARPRCSTCAANDKPCVYPPLYRRANCSQQHVDELEAKLREYERQLAANLQKDAMAQDRNLQQARPVPATDLQAVDSLQFGKGPAQGVESSTIIVDRPQAEPPGQIRATSDRSGPHVQHQQTSLQLQDLDPQASDDERFDSIVSPTPIGSESEDNMEDEAISIIDGIVEYSHLSEKDSTIADAFGDSSTFKFALTMTASKDEDFTESIPSTSPHHGLFQHGTGIDSDRGAHASSASKERRKLDDDVITALKSYIDQSSLQYLPQRHAASKLLQKYFTVIHPIWPFLVEESTRMEFDKTWSSNEVLSPMWIAQLNLIFALACQLYESSSVAPLPNIYEAGKLFYLRASGFVIANSYNLCSIPMLQTLLLAAQYQQGTMRSNECWLTIGTATRMALGLGLHKPIDTNSAISAVDKELCKRLWWGCFSLDRVSSMVYGRPVGIPHMGHPANSSDFPSLVDDRFIALGQSQPVDIPSTNAFYASVVKLYQIMDEILDSLHSTSSGGPNPSSTSNQQTASIKAQLSTHSAISQLPAILRLDALLIRWHADLPPHLKFSLDGFDSSTSLSFILQRQKIILKTRFLGMRILLHRQSILFLLKPPGTRKWPRNTSRKWPPLFSDIGGATAGVVEPNIHSEGELSPFVEAQLARISANICVQMALLQIETIDAGRPLGLSGAWWWDLHFVFNSLCVLFGAIGVQKADLLAIVPDLARTKATIRRGFHNIRDMALRGGPKVVQSERFLRNLLKTMTRRGDKPILQDNQQPQSPSNVQAFRSKTPVRRDSEVIAEFREDISNFNQFSVGLEGTIVDNDPAFVDAFDFLLADQTSSSWPAAESLFNWDNGTSNFEENAQSSFLQGSFDI